MSAFITLFIVLVFGLGVHFAIEFLKWLAKWLGIPGGGKAEEKNERREL